MLLAIPLFSSCGKGLGLCKDMELSFKRQDFSGSLLKTNGYYYEEPDKSGNSPIHYLYRNGVYHGGFKESYEDAKNGNIDVDATNSVLKQTRRVWGAFRLNGNSIEIETWGATYGCSKTISMKGEVNNDTTFVITQIKYMKKNGKVEEEKKVNNTYHYRASLQKPDSTNDFVK